MIGHIVEIAKDDCHLSLRRGFMNIRQAGQDIGQVPIDDIVALVVRGYGASISLNLCSRLSEAGIPVVLCGSDQSPDSVIWPVKGHHGQGVRMQAQAEAARPLRKRLWRDLVRAKIMAQSFVLSMKGIKDARLEQMARTVPSGDTANVEGQAARHYWPLLMGPDFRRDRGDGPVNAMLNYGYTVLRAAAARSILAAGLHPSLSVHHESRGDALRLADDLMEPFRPFIDLEVHTLKQQGVEEGEAFELDRDRKAALVKVLTLDLEGPKGARPLQTAMDALATSLAQVYMGERKTLELPGPPLPLAASG